MWKPILLCTCLLLTSQGPAMADLVENFDNVDGLTSSGWTMINNSAPPGETGWFQGNSSILPSYSGAPDSYIAANYLNAETGGNISDWLITPEISLRDPLLLTFYTRTESPATFGDRLELRLSTHGSSTNVGSSDTSVGDFDILLLTINPDLYPDGYPDAWTRVGAQFTSGFGPGVTGRFAFRYVVPDTSTYGNYIGIDSVSITTIPEATALLWLGPVLVTLALLRRRTRFPHRELA